MLATAMAAVLAEAECVLHPLIHTSPTRKFTRDVEIKKAEPKTPHFLSLNQDIVDWSQDEKCGPTYAIIRQSGLIRSEVSDFATKLLAELPLKKSGFRDCDND